MQNLSGEQFDAPEGGVGVPLCPLPNLVLRPIWLSHHSIKEEYTPLHIDLVFSQEKLVG